MSSVLRSLRPVRRELQKLLKEQPEATVIFPSDAARDQYLLDAALYVNTLKARRDACFQFLEKLILVQCATEADQKAVDEVSEADSTLLLEVDAIIVKYGVILSRLNNDRERSPRNPMLEQNAAQPHQPPVQQPQPGPSVKLPKIDLKRFSGDVLQWLEFWDSFSTAVHNNNSLSAVDKFNYLKGQLTGEAKSAITGLSLTNDNYAQAIDILKRRYGDNQVVINSHYMALSTLPPASDQTPKIRLVWDSLEKHLRSLEALGEGVNHRHFVSMILSKLPRDFIMRLEENRGDEAWSVATLRKRAQKLLEARELADQHHKPPAAAPHKTSSSSNGDASKRTGGHQSTTGSLLANSRARGGTKKTCFYCQGDHWADECTVHTTVEARKKQIRGRCYVCIQEGHSQKDCRSEKACVHCKQKKRHHRSLCPKKFPTQSLKQENAHPVFEPQKQASNSGAAPNAESALVNLDAQGLLQTASARILTGTSQSGLQVRLVFDCGSQRTYATEDLIQRVKAEPQSRETLSIYTFGSSKATSIDTKVVKLQLALLDGSPMEILVHTVPKIGEIHHKLVDVSKYSALYRSLQMADPTDKTPPTRPIDLLIGNNYYWDLITAERIELEKGLYLIGSKLGWVVSGRLGDASKMWDNKPSAVMLTPVADSPISGSPFVDADQALMNEVKLDDWWSLESIGIKDSPQDSVDDTVLERFNESVQYDGQRYLVDWPWKDNVDQLPSNYALAHGRLKSLVRRLKGDAGLLDKYNAIVQSQLQLGIIEKVPDGDNTVAKKHYIPHHPVVTPDKTTTKVRIVYDGSAKARKELPSINECLNRGPVILEDICSLLMRFRMNKVALVADIEKAFLQVGLQPNARDVTRFLWLKDPTKLDTEGNIQIFRFTRVPFGIISSPFLLGAAITYHLLSEGTDVARQLLRDLYVDNMISGASSAQGAIRFYQDAKEMLNSASMNLREWGSNDPEVMKAIPEHDRVGSRLIKILGMVWNIESDTLQLARPSGNSTMLGVTKRTVLRSIATFFDPLGLHGPALVPAKIFLQNLWLEKKGWDDTLTPSHVDAWVQLIQPLDQIQAMPVPRCIGLCDEGPSPIYELHCFTDASMKAYGAAIYLRVQSSKGVSTHLVFSKSRLAPTRAAITIPRLELLAASIGGIMLQFVEKSLNVPVTKRILWTDSQCVLHWIRSSKPLSVFVSNRVKKLRQAPKVEFHYIRTDRNPADLASRGCSVEELGNSSLWWHGPPWISQAITAWPREQAQFQIDSTTLEQISSEQKKTVLFETSMLTGDHPLESPPSPFGIDHTRFSDLTKLLRLTAWCFRFTHQLKGRVTTKGPLVAAELQASRDIWIKYIQRTHFGEVFKALSQGRKVPMHEQLNLWLDGAGMIRCRGRLANADLDRDAICPILLPKKDWFTTLVIRSFHERLLHSGTAHTLSQIRHTFWIPSGRALVRRHINSCLKCKRVEGGPYLPPPMPALPASRVRESAPFTWTGLDYLGPLYVKGKQGTGKVWICLFTCMATRAIHLELVEDLSADQFLLCLRRFVARRGTPTHILSDNAAQFKLVKSATEDLWTKSTRHETIMSYISNLGVNWTFIPERAPWMGGVYERLVQLVKRALRKSLQHLCLTSMQLQTVLAEIEAMLNSRPLVHVGSDFQDGQTLTPAHFLLRGAKIGVPETGRGEDTDPEYIDQQSSRIALLQRWKKGEQHLQAFWRRWHEDYLLNLREQHQHQLKGLRGAVPQLPKVGDIVHIRQEAPRGTWPLARIIRLIPSSDGEIRAAQVQASSGNILTRAILHLYPLEVTDDTKRDDQTAHRQLRQPADISGNDEVEDWPLVTGPAHEQTRPQRRAATKAKERIQAMAQETEDDTIAFVSARPRSSFPSVTYFVLACIVALQLASANAQPMICEKGGAKMVIDLGRVQTCSLDRNRKVDKVYEVTIQLFKRNIAKHESPAYKCSRVTTISQAWTNFATAGFDHRTSEEPIAVSDSECKAMVRDRRCADGPLLGGELASFTGNNVRPPYSTGNVWDCCKWITAKTTNCFMLKGKVYQTFGAQMESNLGNVVDCTYEKESCMLPDHSMLIWTANKNASCEYILWKTIEGKIWNNQFLSSDLEIALTWNHVQQTTTTCNGILATLTDQGVPMVVSQRTLISGTAFSSPRTKREATAGVDASDAVAIRLQALELRLDNLFRETLNHAYSTACRSIQELQEVDLVLAHAEPTLIARRLLNDSRIIARLYGQFLEVWPCSPVDHFVFLKMGDKCTEWIPANFTVRGTSSLGYVDPKTFIIYENSAPVDCDVVQETYFLDPNQVLSVYTAHNGIVKPYGGQLVKHALHSAKMMELIDFTAVIHKPIQLYTQRELRAQSSLNDLFASMDSHAEVLRQLGQVAQDSPKSKEAQAILDTVSSLTPWGIFNLWVSKILWIWVYTCCTLFTIQNFGSLFIRCIRHRLGKRLRQQQAVQPARTTTELRPGTVDRCPPTGISLVDVVKETMQVQGTGF